MKRKQKYSTRKKVLVAMVSVLAVILVVLLAGTIYIEWMLGRFYYDPDGMATLSQEEIMAQLQDNQGSTLDPNIQVIDPDDIELGPVNKIEAGEHIFNVLLIGQDRRPGEPRMRSDVMLLVTIDTQDRSVTMTSFLRDLYVQIPGYYKNRINVAYYLGGAELLFDTIEQNFGVRPDKFVEVDFNGFKDVVDLAGGVDIELTAREAAHMNANEAYYLFPGEVWNLKEGLNHLTGSQALTYARIRKIDPTGDFARTERQRKVIAAMVEKAAGLNLLDINDLILKTTDFVTTDMTSKEIMSYAVSLYPVLADMETMNSLRIPADGQYYMAGIDGIGSVLVPNLEGNRAIIAQYQD